jgi:hypothetical protein
MRPGNKRVFGSPTSASDPATGAVAIDYSGGDQVLAEYSRGIYISTAGDLAVVMANGDAVIFEDLAAGQVYPFSVKQITATGSAAAGVVLL